MNFSLLTLFLALIISACSSDKPKQQALKPTQQIIKPTIPKFDGTKAFEFLKAQTDFGPRAPGSAGHEKCLNYFYSEMQKYASTVILQNFTHKGYDGKNIIMTNVISSFNLKATTRILLLAHWDTRPRADLDPDPKNREKPILGANDGASGIAVLMEIARHLRDQPPMVGIDMLFTDGEDYGKEGDNNHYLLGAKYFAKNLTQGFKPVFGILLDMIGDKNLEIKKEQYSLRFAPDVVELVWNTAKELGIYQFSDEEQNWVLDDHIPLNDAGIKTINLIDFEYPDETNRYWHTLEDAPDKCSPESLEAVGIVLMHIIYNYKLQF